jgi:hypothetical protein
LGGRQHFPLFPPSNTLHVDLSRPPPHTVATLRKAPVRPAATSLRYIDRQTFHAPAFCFHASFYRSAWRLLTMHSSTLYLPSHALHFSISSCSSVLPTLFSSDPMMLVSACLPTSFDALYSISRQRLAKSWTCSSSLPSPSSTRA